MIKFQLKDIPLIGKYLISNKTINANKDELNTMDNNYDIAFKYNSSQDCFGNKLHIDDKVSYVTTYYDDRFNKICTGTVVGFTNCFIKIKPDEKYKITWKEKTTGYILRYKNRIIKMN